MKGEEQQEHDYLYWEFHEQGGKQDVRKGKWKLVKLNVFDPSKTRFELFDLEADLSEENNIADQHPEVVVELQEIMDKAHEHNADFPFEGRK